MRIVRGFAPFVTPMTKENYKGIVSSYDVVIVFCYTSWGPRYTYKDQSDNEAFNWAAMELAKLYPTEKQSSGCKKGKIKLVRLNCSSYGQRITRRSKINGYPRYCIIKNGRVIKNEIMFGYTPETFMTFARSFLNEDTPSVVKEEKKTLFNKDKKYRHRELQELYRYDEVLFECDCTDSTM